MDLYGLYSVCKNPILFLPAHIIAIVCIIIFLRIFNLKKFKELLSGDFLNLTFNKNVFRTNVICLLCSFVILFSTSSFAILLGSEDIRLMPNGIYCYYVYATNEKDKTYTLPAKIYKGYDVYESENSDGDIITKQTDIYCVKNVYFKNGGYLYFEDSEYFKYNSKGYAIDQNGNSWDIELSNRKTYHEKVSETNPESYKKMIFPFVEIFSLIFIGISYSIFQTSNKKRTTQSAVGDNH